MSTNVKDIKQLLCNSLQNLNSLHFLAKRHKQLLWLLMVGSNLNASHQPHSIRPSYRRSSINGHTLKTCVNITVCTANNFVTDFFLIIKQISFCNMFVNNLQQVLWNVNLYIKFWKIQKTLVKPKEKRSQMSLIKNLSEI